MIRRLLLMFVLGAMSLGVSAQSRYAATITWKWALTRTDGSTFTIANIKYGTVWYGTTSGSYTKSFQVVPSKTQIVIDVLACGTWYFAMTETLIDGTTSVYTSPVSKTFQCTAPPFTIQ